MNRTLAKSGLLSLTMLATTSSALASTFVTGPAVSSPGPGLLNVYAGINPTGYLSRKRFTGSSWETSWTTFHPLPDGTGVIPTGDPAAQFYGALSTQQEAVCIPTNPQGNNVTIICSVHNLFDGSWVTLGPADNVNGALALAAQDTVNPPTQTLYLFAISNGFLQYATFPSSGRGWSNFARANGPSTSPDGGFASNMASVAAVGVGRSINICVRVNGMIADQYWCTSSSDLSSHLTWTQAPGSWGSKPSLASNSLGLMLGGVSSFDTQVWTTAGSVGNWGNPAPRSGDLNSGPSMVGWGGDTIHIFARARFDNNIWYTYFDHGQWATTWFPL